MKLKTEFKIHVLKFIAILICVVMHFQALHAQFMPEQIFEMNYPQSDFGGSAADAGDLNGDGYDDIVIGANVYEFDDYWEGAAFVYMGAASGYPDTPSVILQQDNAFVRMGWCVASGGDINADGYDDLLVSAKDLWVEEYEEGGVFIYYGSASGISSIPDDTVTGGQFMASAGYAVACAGDVNGDGYDDLILGIPNYDNGSTNEGIVRIYYGSASGINPIPATMMEGNQSTAYFGISVSGAGDVNNDGYDDIIVGATNYNDPQTDEGVAFVYHGSPTGINIIPVTKIECNNAFAYLGREVASAGDINNDGYADIAVSVDAYHDGGDIKPVALIYMGSAIGIDTATMTLLDAGEGPGTGMGRSISKFDVNNDGYSDLLIGAPWFSCIGPLAGKVFIFHGNETGINIIPAYTIEINQAVSVFGSAVVGVKDINGDNLDDILIGAESYENGEYNEGGAFFYFGDSCIGSYYYSDQDGDGFGYAPYYIVSCNMMDGFISDTTDCNDTIALINPLTTWYIDEDIDNFYADTGSPLTQCPQPAENYSYQINGGGDCNDINEFVYPDAPELFDGLDNNCDGYTDENFTWELNATLEGNLTPAWMGNSVASAGDVNGDGYDDIISGAINYTDPESEEGAAFLYFGAAEGIDSIPDAKLEINQINGAFGHSVASAGDVNGDGFDDVIVSATYYTNGEVNEGGAFLYYGSSSGISNVPDDTLEPNIAYTIMGTSVNSAGDINADGFDEVIVTAEYYSNGQTSEGAAFLYMGSAAGISLVPVMTFESNQVYGRLASAASAGDVNADGYDDIIVGCYLYDYGVPDNNGRVYLFYGSAAGTDNIPDLTLTGALDGENFGSSVSSAGDVNNDGFDDIIIGAKGYEDDTGYGDGAAFIYYGSADGVETFSYAMLESFQGSDFGVSVAFAGDINDDGFDDVLIGADNSSHPEFFEGMVFIYPGSASGIISEPLVTMESNQTSAYFGFSAASAGDVNGDGHPDIIVGAKLYDDGEISEGAAFVYTSCYNIYFIDADGDGYGSNADTAISCGPTPGFVSNTDDCDDLNPLIYPAAIEFCNDLDDNCNGIIDEEAIETISISADGPVVFCPTDSVVLHAEFTGETLQWFKNGNAIPGAINANYTAKKKGFYTCETYSSCDTVLSNIIFVNELKGPPASILADGPTTFCEGESVTLSANTGIMLSYQWYKNGDLIPGANTINYLATTDGNYKCMVTKAFTGCYKLSNTISVTVPCKQGEWAVVSGEMEFKISPNPNNGTFEISVQNLAPAKSLLGGFRPARMNRSDGGLNIYNSLGQVIYTQQINSSDNNFIEKISFNNISAGIYFINISDGVNSSQEKLIIQ